VLPEHLSPSLHPVRTLITVDAEIAWQLAKFLHREDGERDGPVRASSDQERVRIEQEVLRIVEGEFERPNRLFSRKRLAH
jgi:hypothetical protein